MHAIYSEIRLRQCARVDYFYNNNVQEEPSLSEQEIKKNEYKLLLTTGTKTADPNEIKEESCWSDEFAEFM